MKVFFALLLGCGLAFGQTTSSVSQKQEQPLAKVGHPTGDPKPVHPPEKHPEQNQSQSQHQQQQQGQSQAQEDNSSSTSNSGGNSVQNTSVYRQVRQAPMAYAPDAVPSAPCRVSGSAGLSSAVGGLSLGGSKLDKECDKRETARAFALIGQTQAALQILCSTKAAKVVKDCTHLPLVVSETPENEARPAPRVEPAPEPVRVELDPSVSVTALETIHVPVRIEPEMLFTQSLQPPPAIKLRVKKPSGQGKKPTVRCP